MIYENMILGRIATQKEETAIKLAQEILANADLELLGVKPIEIPEED